MAPYDTLHVLLCGPRVVMGVTISNAKTEKKVSFVRYSEKKENGMPCDVGHAIIDTGARYSLIGHCKLGVKPATIECRQNVNIGLPTKKSERHFPQQWCARIQNQMPV